jgi:probable rRNA maturation factor
MAEADIQVQIDSEFQGFMSADWLASLVRETLFAEGVSGPTEVGLVVTGQQAVERLNKDYLGEEGPTDVLAFSLTESSDDSPPFLPPPDGVTRLGEVIIAYPQATKQAAEHGHSVERELALLTVHGVLHLLGYDHSEPQEEVAMQTREREILERAFHDSGEAGL